MGDTDNQDLGDEKLSIVQRIVKITGEDEIKCCRNGIG